MSTITTFHPLTKLRPFKNAWRVQVKCLHSWRMNTVYGDTFEMVLADQWRELPQGKWGIIENMQMSPNGGKTRATRHRYKMAIGDETVVKGCNFSDDRLFLSPANYEDVQKAGEKDVPYLIDVIGRVHQLGNVQTVRAQGQDKKRVEFRLIDSKGNDLPCCLWESYADQIEAFVDEFKDQTIICLLRFAKIQFFRGEVQITNAFGASRLYLNPTEPEVLELTERLADADLQFAPVAPE